MVFLFVFLVVVLFVFFSHSVTSLNIIRKFYHVCPLKDLKAASFIFVCVVNVPVYNYSQLLLPT